MTIEKHERSTKDLVKAAVSGWLGTALEFMDFQLYSLGAALVFHEIFFPESSTAMALIQAIMEQDERQVQIGAGDITLLDASRPCSLYWQESSKQISLLLPRTLLEQYFPHQKPVCAERLDADLPMVQLSHRLLQESMNNPALSETESEAALQAMVCLLRPVLHQRESVQPRRERQFQKVVTLIDDNIREEILRPEWIAGETGMSVRSLYRMFADKGLVVAQYIRNRRLDFCADAIRHAADDEKLAGIGFHWGFSTRRELKPAAELQRL